MRIAIVQERESSATAVRALLERDGRHQVIWLGNDGVDAVARCARDLPDVLLMDLRLPRIDGVEATKRIMEKTPTAILIVTDAIGSQASRVFDALRYGAVDAIDGSLEWGGRGARRLLAKLEMVALLNHTDTAHAGAHRGGGVSIPAVAAIPLVALGSSTGGPGALATILADISDLSRCAVVIVQHLDPGFVTGLVGWLQKHTSRTVSAALAGEEIQQGRVYIAATGDHIVLDPQRRFRYVDVPREVPYRPSVDVFFDSLARHWTPPGVAALLTGMGSDGAAGLLALRRSGWYTLAQDQQTSVVYGMPKAAVALGAACETLALAAVGPAIRRHLEPSKRKSTTLGVSP